MNSILSIAGMVVAGMLTLSMTLSGMVAPREACAGMEDTNQIDLVDNGVAKSQAHDLRH